MSEVFFRHPQWVKLFENEKEQKLLIRKFKNDPQWLGSLENPNWSNLFLRKPELFWRKQEWFKRIANKLEEPDGVKWFEQFAENDEWNKLFDDSPEWALVYAFELETVNENRKRRKPDSPDKIEKENLIGLAFSGGGIRSASFGLGVLEALRDFGLLKQIDYLSTVSGGGYIGGWLSANCKRASEEKIKIDWLASGKNKEEKKQQKKNGTSPLIIFVNIPTIFRLKLAFSALTLGQWRPFGYVIPCLYSLR